MILLRSHYDAILEIEPVCHEDNRGLFFESLNHNLKSIVPELNDLVQINTSYSKKNVLRGLHLQLPPKSQGKLCTVLYGEVIDIAVDLRKDSKTFAKHLRIEISHQKPKMVWIPPGFAHGFLVISEFAVFQYLCTDTYHKELERTILYSDKDIAIDWGVQSKFIISEKDKAGITLQEYLEITSQ